MKPDICTSWSCEADLESDYCPKCSHAIYTHEGKDTRGKTWRFEFSPRFGVEFMTKKWESSKRQPTEKNKFAWDVFEKWYDKYRPPKDGK